MKVILFCGRMFLNYLNLYLKIADKHLNYNITLYVSEQQLIIGML